MGPYEVAVAMATEAALDALWLAPVGVSRPCPSCGADATKHSTAELAARMGSCRACMESMHGLEPDAHGVHNTALGVRAQHVGDSDPAQLQTHLAVMAMCLALSSVQALLAKAGPVALLVLSIMGREWQDTHPGGPAVAQQFIELVVGACLEQYPAHPLVQRFALASLATGPELEA